MLIIEPKKGESTDRMIRRYKRKVERTRLIRKVRSKFHFMKGSELRRREVSKAIHRERYKRLYL